MLEDAKAVIPPRYIHDGLTWFERAVGKDIAENEPMAASV